MILITGDTHLTEIKQRLSISNLLSEGVISSKSEYAKITHFIICGDFGLGWSGYNKSHKHYKQDKDTYDWLCKLPFDVLFCCGNHERFPYINSQPVVNYCNGKAHKLSNNIYHLMRGEVFTIEDKTFFAMGGGDSLDKNNRTEHIDWWKEEMPNYTEYANAIDNLEKINNKVGYVITHEPPLRILRDLFKFQYISGVLHENELEVFLDGLMDKIDFHKWYFGHLHLDGKIGNKFYMLFRDIRIVE